MNRRTKQVLWTTAGIVVLAAVIFAGGALSNPDAPPAPAPRPTALQSAQTYAGQAAAALASNDASAAVRLANQALALDGSNATARQVLESAKNRSASAPAEEKATAAAPAPRDDSAYLEKIDGIQALLPQSIEGWSAGAISAEGSDALVTFEPTSGVPEYGTTTRVVFSAHDRKTASKAKKFVSAVNKKAYPGDALTVQVGVMPKAYFGTNEAGGAVVAFSRGRYAFEVTVVAQGSSTDELKKTATKLAASLPAAR